MINKTNMKKGSNKMTMTDTEIKELSRTTECPHMSSIIYDTNNNVFYRRVSWTSIDGKTGTIKYKNNTHKVLKDRDLSKFVNVYALMERI